MKRGVNKVILIGNCGANPELRQMPSGGIVATLSIATTDAWKDKQSGQLQEHTEWHRVVFFNRLAEIVGEYLHKGSKAYIEGSLRTNKWQDKNGQDRYTTEIIANTMQMLDNRNPSHGTHASTDRTAADTKHVHSPQTAATTEETVAPAGLHTSENNVAGNFDAFDDDIPF